MLPHYAIKFQQARDWIILQDPATLTYQTLLNYCKLLEQWCKQFQKAQQKGRADLTSIVATSATNSSIHQDSISTHPNQTGCYRCEYSHQRNNCPATGQQCHKCNGIGHFSALYRTRTHRYGYRKADTITKGPAITDTAADHPAETVVHHLGETDVQTAQSDTIHTASRYTDKAQHHITSVPL